jgi:hypothetical protein
MIKSSVERLNVASQEVARLRRQARDVATPLFQESLAGLKRYQAQRLASTHADLLEDPRYRLATQFFLQDLYGEKDFAQRDQELKRVLPTLNRFLPDSALSTIADAVELDALSEYLDQQMAWQNIETNGALWTERTYRQAYSALALRAEATFGSTANGRTLRERQLVLVPRIGATLEKLVRNPLLGGLLSSMATPARLAGVPAMHDFLSRGFKAFQSMRGAKQFLVLIETRERALFEQLLN